MVEFRTFSRLKNIFNRFNPLNSFNWNDQKDEEIIVFSSKDLLESVIVKYPEFKKVILLSLYHLINTNDENNEFLTVLTKDNNLIADLVEGERDNVSIPYSVKVESNNDNILVACHNHFFGAIIPSLDDISTAINHNCQFLGIVSCNHIGIIVIECDKINYEQFITEFNWFKEYIGFCLDVEKGMELDKIDMIDMSEGEREIIKSIIHDKFISENIEKFVHEFNYRFNKFKIYEVYIKL